MACNGAISLSRDSDEGSDSEEPPRSREGVSKLEDKWKGSESRP